jgi:Domain of Unknown Function (DUF1080)
MKGQLRCQAENPIVTGLRADASAATGGLQQQLCVYSLSNSNGTNPALAPNPPANNLNMNNHFLKSSKQSLTSSISLIAGIWLLTACSPSSPQGSAAPQGQWISIFNGKNLDGWTAKIAGHDAGDNYANTFRVTDGVLQVAYDQYGNFENQFGGLYYKEKLSHYWLRVEYRFIGSVAKGAPGWAFRDSGVMLHSQSPDGMQKTQQFPTSIELNLIGARIFNRPTGDVCTNGGVLIQINGQTLPNKCSNSSKTSIRGEQWVTAEAEVLGNTSIKHYINGELVTEYQQPQLDEKDADAARLLAAGASKQLTEGYLALQSNGAPIEFRKVEILPLSAPAEPAPTAATPAQ